MERLVAEEAALEAEQRAKEKAADRRRGGRPAPTAQEDEFDELDRLAEGDGSDREG